MKIAVIGTGWWATETHLPALQEDARKPEILLCDRDPQRLNAAAEAFNLGKCYTDHHQMLEVEKPDGVIVATNHASHYAITLDCLLANAHVLVEKPLTLYGNEAKHLAETAAQRGLAMLVGYPWNYTPTVNRVREHILNGALGSLQFITCVFNSHCIPLYRANEQPSSGNYRVHGPGAVYSNKEASGGGHGHLQMTHALGLLFHAIDQPFVAVRASMSNHHLPVDLVNGFLVEFADTCIGIIGGTSNTYQYRMSLQIHGSVGGATLEMHDGTASIRLSNGDVEEVKTDSETYPLYAPTQRLVSIIAGETPPYVDNAGRYAAELLHAAYLSAEGGGERVLREGVL